MTTFSERDRISEVVSRLFVYTDERKWDKLLNEVFAPEVHLDMSSLGGKISKMQAIDICNMWKDGFKDLDYINHLAGNYIIDINDNSAKVIAYSTATHYKESATKGKTREFVGTYDLNLLKLEKGWRIVEFKYNLKYMSGNLNLE